MKNTLLFFFISLLSGVSFSQTFPEQDCINAIPVIQDTLVQTSVYSGWGSNSNEINGQISCLSEGEKNGVWYSYCVKISGNLCFSLVPVDNTADFDWAVFNLTDNGCDEIYYDSSLEVSCNFSSVPGITGPNGMSGTQNEPCIRVSAGERYAIYISMFTIDNSGYTLYFNASTAEPDTNCQFQPDSCNLNANVIIQQPACYGDSNGNASIVILSGLSPYSYIWSNGQISNINSNLSAGNYSVTITDSIGCTYVRQAVITDPSPISCNMSSYPASSDTSCNGQAVAAINGGTPPYSYTWSGGTAWNSGSTTGSYVCTGTYFLTVTDYNNCLYIDSVDIYITTTEKNLSLNLFRIFPDPFRDETMLEFSNQKNTSIKMAIMNLQGQVVEERIVETSPGMNSISLGKTLKTPGVYFVKVISGEAVFTQKDLKTLRLLISCLFILSGVRTSSQARV